MKQKKVYEREIVTNLTTVAGNISDFKQQYEIKFYPKADDLPDKIALYIYLTRADKQFAKRSIYFSSAEQLKELIFNLTKSYFYFRDKKNPLVANREQFRLVNLDDFLVSLKGNQRNIWKQGTY